MGPGITSWPSLGICLFPAGTRPSPNWFFSVGLVARGRGQCPTSLTPGPQHSPGQAHRCSGAALSNFEGPCGPAFGSLGADSGCQAGPGVWCSQCPELRCGDPSKEPGRESATPASIGQLQHRPARGATPVWAVMPVGPGQLLSEAPTWKRGAVAPGVPAATSAPGSL